MVNFWRNEENLPRKKNSTDFCPKEFGLIHIHQGEGIYIHTYIHAAYMLHTEMNITINKITNR